MLGIYTVYTYILYKKFKSEKLQPDFNNRVKAPLLPLIIKIWFLFLK